LQRKDYVFPTIRLASRKESKRLKYAVPGMPSVHAVAQMQQTRGRLQPTVGGAFTSGGMYARDDS
jgi:hypothetical protein